MIQVPIASPMSFEAFLEWYPEDGRRYELIEGVVIEMLPTGPHEDVGGFLGAELNVAIRQHQLPYSIPRSCLIKPQAEGSGYLPDVVVLNREVLPQEPLWSTASVIQYGQTIPLVIEVVSTNWRDDDGHKLVEYEAMGLPNIGWWIFVRSVRCVTLGCQNNRQLRFVSLKGASTKCGDLWRARSWFRGYFPN